ncbi:hypothetical protein MalM14_51600 [Gimesia chilikensis]|nr:hypothetical protein MalM14_51600 [Gimesia chilikensis]
METGPFMGRCLLLVMRSGYNSKDSLSQIAVIPSANILSDTLAAGTFLPRSTRCAKGPDSHEDSGDYWRRIQRDHGSGESGTIE